MQLTGVLDLTRHIRDARLYTPTVPFASAYPYLVRWMGHRSTIFSVSVASLTTSSLRKMRISKSSEPTSSSLLPSPSASQNAIADTLSPVTVQNSSRPAASKPWMEQLPPTTTSGASMVCTLPKSSVETPSGTSLKNKSLLSSVLYASRFVCVPTHSVSPSPSTCSRPLVSAVTLRLMFRKRMSWFFGSVPAAYAEPPAPPAAGASRLCGEWMKTLPAEVPQVSDGCLPS
mmetsp:Transcript_15195/g.52796  ORF Transcript_15195/g.52796 Transcript_15195/m.52796 type:complete len:230 (-) Transcript_15195:439-1128(-)